MGVFQQILFYCFLLSAFFTCAQQSYNPFQYGNNPNPIQAPFATNLQQMNMQQQMQTQQQNYQQMIRMGGTPPPTQAEIKAAWELQLQGKAPKPTRQQQIEKEMVDLMQEIKKDEAKLAQTDYYHSPEYLQDVPNYKKAKDLIKSMLNGKIPLSVKDAYYFMESTYGNLHLTYDEYNKLIEADVGFIKQWLTENKYSITNPEALHYGIQKFLSDTIYCTINGKKKGHIPYYYDYIDFKAQDDRRNYFVTKTLATGSGQCHTLPVVYLIFAEQLGINAYIAYNPRHSFICYKNNSGTIINYETTVDRFLPDAFYLETLPVMAKTQKNNVYINMLDRQHIIVSTLYILASNFVEEHYLADKSFIKECMAIADPYFPNQEYICIEHYNLQKILYADEFNALVKLHKLQTMSEIENYPDVVEAYKNYYGYMDRISQLGIQDLSNNEDVRMMEYYDVKGKLQAAKKTQAKTKKSLFIN